MSSIIQKWLGTRLGIILNMKPENFGVHVSDGTLLARLLHSYDVINIDQVRAITPSKNPFIRYHNLKLLKPWLEFVGVQCSDDALQEISNEKGSTSLLIFYHLYRNLEDKDILFFLKQRIKLETVGSGMDVHFEGDEVLNSEIDKPISDSDNPLSIPLVEKQYVKEWHEQKMEEIRKRHQNIENNIHTYFEKKQHVGVKRITKLKTEEEGSAKEVRDVLDEINTFNEKHNMDQNLDESLSYESLLNLQNKAQGYKSIDDNIIFKKDILETLKNKIRKLTANRTFKVQMQNTLLEDVWYQLMEVQEKNFDDVVVKKLLKQSQYEKQIATKLFQIRHEKQIMAQNRAIVETLTKERREEEFLNSLIKLRKEKDISVLNNQFLDEKNIELHRKLYAEKLQLQQEVNEDICAETVEALVDIAVSASDYRSENRKFIPPKIWNEWKALFLKNEPIFDIIDGVENIIDEKYAQEMEEIVKLEVERQGVLNDHDIDEYLHLLGPWLVKDLCPDLESCDGNQIVLGFIVHRLLDIKYPLPSSPRPADLPKMEVAAMVVGINDKEVLNILRDLLANRAIYVVNMDDAIRYCLQQFKTEMSVVTDIDLNFATTTKKTVEELKSKTEVTHKKQKDNLKSKSKPPEKNSKKGSSKSQDTKVGPDIEVVATDLQGIYEKGTQTPRCLPEDDPLLTHAAQLGRNAFEALSLGEQVSDDLLVAMLVEYLKIQTDIKGWVIFNYPLNYAQASKLETIMSGKVMPIIVEDPEEAILFEVINEIEPRAIGNDHEKEQSLEEFRTSKLFPNPIPKPVNDTFKTYFTAYINVKKTNTPIEKMDYVEIVDEYTLLSPLERIYTDEGINYTFYYRTFDIQTIKQLAKLIIGDMELPLKSSIELFGEVLHELETTFSLGIGKGPNASQCKKKVNKANESTDADQLEETIELVEEMVVEEPTVQKQKGKKEKESKAKGKKEKGKKGKEEKATDNEEVAKTETRLALEKKSKKSVVDAKGKEKGKKGQKVEENVNEVPGPTPGEGGWEYINLNQPEVIQLALATLWNNLERVYLKDFKQVFFLKRIHHSLIVPYFNHIRNQVTQFIQRPDFKQEHVFKFLTEFNELDEDLRPDVEIKSELHCRVHELRNLLWHICDERKQETEMERRKIIRDNWVAQEMCYLTNIFLEAFQLESDRCVDTVQLLHDYYVTMLRKLPSNTRVNKIHVSRVDLATRDPSVESMEQFSEIKSEKEEKKRKGDSLIDKKQFDLGSTSKRIHRLRAESIKETIANFQINANSSRDTYSPFHEIIVDKANVLTNHIETLKSTFKDIILKECEDMFQKSGKAETKGKGKKEKIPSKSGKNGKSSKGIKSDKCVNESGLDNTAKEEERIQALGKNLIAEWETALHSEIHRMLFRLQLLKARVLKELSEILNSAQDTFFGLETDINARYEREILAVNMLCKVICSAIEDEAQIQQELVLEQDSFYVNENVLLFPNPPPPPPSIIEERVTREDFQVSQLNLLLEKLTRAAPKGWLSERAFVYILEDMAVSGTEEGEGRLLPTIWSELTTKEICLVIDKVFYGMPFVDWRDFILYTLNIKFPSESEILNLHKAYQLCDTEKRGIITHEDYHSINLWFEENITDDAHENLRIYLIKEFLFSLFQFEVSLCNYTSLLLHFCKDVEPETGFAKALALSIGKRIVFIQEEYELIIDGLPLSDSRTSTEITLAAYETSHDVLEEVLLEVIQYVSGIVITEIRSETELINYDMDLKMESQNRERWINGDIDRTPAAPCSSAENIPQLIPVKKYSPLVMQSSNFQSTPLSNLPRTVYLVYEEILNVLTVSLPWHDILSNLPSDSSSLSEQLKAVYEELHPGRNGVHAFKLFQNPFIRTLLQSVNKFKIYSVKDIILDIIQSRSNNTSSTK